MDTNFKTVKSIDNVVKIPRLTKHVKFVYFDVDFKTVKDLEEIFDDVVYYAWNIEKCIDTSKINKK